MEKYLFIKTRKAENVFYLTLARPEKRNAFTPTMVSEIADALMLAQNDTNIWLILIDAEGPVFCAGMDMKVFQKPELDSKNEQIPVTDLPLGEIIRNINKPIIAKVEGPVMAGGILIIAECTFVAADENATFSLPEVKRGIFPFQVMHSLSRILPERKILEMCILAKTYSAAEAAILGIVTHFFEKSAFEFGLKNLVDNVLSGAPLAISKGIEMSKNMQSIPTAERHQYLKTAVEKLRNSADAQEGISAFIQKREPIWRNC